MEVNYIDVINRELEIIKNKFGKFDKDELIIKELFEVFNKYNCKRNSIKNLLKDVNKVLDFNVLTYLTLTEDEFDVTNESDDLVNIRCPYIYKEDNGRIYYTNAFIPVTKDSYNYPDVTKPISNNLSSVFTNKIYITKGGVTNGEYFDICYIKEDVVNSGTFFAREAVKIPVSSVLIDGVIVFTVDFRNSKIKALFEFYDTPIKTCDDIKGLIDIRKLKCNKVNNIKG